MSGSGHPPLLDRLVRMAGFQITGRLLPAVAMSENEAGLTNMSHDCSALAPRQPRVIFLRGALLLATTAAAQKADRIAAAR